MVGELVGQLVGVGELVPGRAAHELVVELRRDTLRTDLVQRVLDVRVGQLLAIDEDLQVQGHEVAGRGVTLDLVDLGEAFTQLLELGVDVGVVHVPLRERELDAGVVRCVELGADLDLCGEGAPLGLVEDLDVDLGHRHRDDLLGLQRLGVVVRQRVLHGLLGDHTRADALLDEATRRLAGAEPGQGDLLGQLLGGDVERLLDARRFDLDGQLDLHRVDGLDGRLHGGVGLSGRRASDTGAAR